MDNTLQIIITAICSIVASGGFWAFLQSKTNKKDLMTQMLIGLGHDRIVNLGLYYIDRGWITDDEYENLNDYLYKPYEKLGGNGSAAIVMSNVRKLEMRPRGYKEDTNNENE